MSQYIHDIANPLSVAIISLDMKFSYKTKARLVNSMERIKVLINDARNTEKIISKIYNNIDESI